MTTCLCRKRDKILHNILNALVAKTRETEITILSSLKKKTPKNKNEIRLEIHV